jgi:arylsulfatase A-like enzyme
MRRGRGRAGVAIVATALGLLLGGSSCVRSCRGRSEAVTLELAPRAWLADRSSSRETVLFGTPGAERYLASGFHWETDGTAFAWSAQECALRFEWERRQPRRAILSLSASPGNREQTVAVSLNGTQVAELAVGETEEPHRIDLPVEAQRDGENELRFAFAQASPLTQGAVRRMAARFSSIVVGAAADSGLDDLAMRDAPAEGMLLPPENPTDIVQIGPATLSFSLAPSADAELHVVAALHPAARSAGAEAEVAVLVEREGELPEAIWTGRLDPRVPESQEIVALLPAVASGEPVRVTLQTLGKPDARFAWVTWKHPRIVGREPFPANPGTLTRQPGGGRRALPAEMPVDAGVVLIVVDAARAENLGAYGYARRTTPEIDRIAREGVVFERAYTPAVHTLGAMSSVWTSLYPDAHHRGLPFSVPLPEGHPTLADALERANVPTYGIIANAMAGRANGLDRGFGTFREIYDHPTLGSRAEVFREGLADLLDSWRAGRFLAYLHYREPHFPYDPPRAFAERFGPDSPLTKAQRAEREWYTSVNEGAVTPTTAEVDHLVRLYDGNLAYVDAEIGWLRRELEARGIWDRSVVIVTADHGEQLYEDGYIGHSAQVREESARVPLIVRFPPRCRLEGRRVGEIVSLVDLAPTLAEILGAQWPPEGVRVGGSSILPVLAGGPGDSGVLVRTVWERPEYALVVGPWKLSYKTRTGAQRLVNLAQDPDERTDLAEGHPVRTSELRQALLAWVARLARGPQLEAARRTMTRHECENLCALGYVDCADCE